MQSEIRSARKKIDAMHNSKALSTKWVHFLRELERQSKIDKDTPRMRDYAFRTGGISPGIVIDLLLSPNELYPGHKDILFAGLCAWTVSPNRPHLQREAMILAGASHLAGIEKEYRKALPDDPILADLTARLLGPSLDFYRDFYYEIGGLQQIIKTRSPALMRRTVRAASEDIMFAVDMMSVCHYIAENLNDRRYFRVASLNAGGKAVSSLRVLRGEQDAVNGLNCKKKSAPFRRSSALIYAAYTLHLPNGGTLLDEICRGTASYKIHKGVIGSWIGRAVYVSKSVISPMYKRGTILDQTSFLPNIKEIEFSPPKYTDEEALDIKRIFGTREWRAMMRNDIFPKLQ